ncbi:MAG: VWA domain-containing protein [Candidatus Protochlamydia sp.]|nr:VWA domain-containing protein [Candidatus Protochlamydia sp.]
MSEAAFTIDYLALGLLALFSIAAFYIHSFIEYRTPHIKFSNLIDLNKESKKVRASYFPRRLYQGALLFLGLAFIDPHFTAAREEPEPKSNKQRTEIPTEGIAIYLLLDRSGSMNQKIETRGYAGKNAISKKDLLKETVEQFILQRPDDLIGLVAFARVPAVLAPLTLDQEALLSHLKALTTVENPEEDGSSIGYAIYKTAMLISATRHFAKDLQAEGKPAYEIKNAIMIVVTDGFQDPNKLDYGNRLRTIELDEAAAYAKKEGIRLYIINIDPSFALAEFAPHRRQMKTLTEMTGGQFFLVGRGERLGQILETINRLEKTTLPVSLSTRGSSEEKKRGLSFYPFLIMMGLGCFAAALLLESTFLRKFP